MRAIAALILVGLVGKNASAQGLKVDVGWKVRLESEVGELEAF